MTSEERTGEAADRTPLKTLYRELQRHHKHPSPKKAKQAIWDTSTCLALLASGSDEKKQWVHERLQELEEDIEEARKQRDGLRRELDEQARMMEGLAKTQPGALLARWVNLESRARSIRGAVSRLNLLIGSPDETEAIPESLYRWKAREERSREHIDEVAQRHWSRLTSGREDYQPGRECTWLIAEVHSWSVDSLPDVMKLDGLLVLIPEYYQDSIVDTRDIREKVEALSREQIDTITTFHKDGMALGDAQKAWEALED